MANHIYTTEDYFVTPSSVTAVSEAAGREAQNVLTWSRPNRLFIGTGAVGSEALTFDFGTAVTLPAVFVDNYNTDGVTIQGNATDSWGAPSYSESFNPTGDNEWGRDRIYCATTLFVNYRYMRILPRTGTTTDGSSVWKVGGVLCVDSVFTVSENFGFPFDVEIFEPVDRQQRVGAPPEVSILGEKRFVLGLSQPVATENMDTDARTILNQGEGRHVLFYRNNGDLREAWCMKRVSRNAYSQTGVRVRSLQNVLFEEVA